MSQLGAPELLIIGVVLILLFGAKKLPDTARALGQSLRMFKKETSKMREEDEPAPTVVKAEPVPPQQIPSTPSVEERLRTLEEENRRLKATAEPTVNGVPLSQAQNDQRSS
ncbi:Sec-independent protein translocase subunit TatA [Microbispora sp. RL4-1S]|uniref:Sec-independent protein translocase protein TatA n=1 Tax=Microbispora oryzae TaxID=2806554 RepID=A0A940WGP8_9ACTN|nr:Sec-independent protein translocase subunit TatA [Microbispora oryzae]MBP2703697.1 Sec-independent protein translocase subunit TatA [Microbispora oryzae]